jgi:hypothetical protein
MTGRARPVMTSAAATSATSAPSDSNGSNAIVSPMPIAASPKRIASHHGNRSNSRPYARRRPGLSVNSEPPEWRALRRGTRSYLLVQRCRPSSSCVTEHGSMDCRGSPPDEPVLRATVVYRHLWRGMK